MNIKVKNLLFLNKLFPLPVHPFNTQLNGGKTYEMWQYEKGEVTIKNYLDYTDADKMFSGKTVLDVGCGAGGKSLYYASLGAKEVVGIDIVEKYAEKSSNLAKQLDINNFKYILCDASKTDFPDNSFDTVIMNDAMEHVAEPEKVLDEMYRILKPGGKVFCNFPPYDHPYGAHLSDAIGIPWVHKFFSDNTLIDGYKYLVKNLPDGKDRINFRISKNADGKEYFSYINKMTIKRFNNIQKNTKFKTVYYKEIPLRKFLSFLATSPFKEMFVKMVVVIFEK